MNATGPNAVEVIVPAQEIETSRYVPSPAERKWRRYRLEYYGLHVLVFLFLAAVAGPNLWLFHSLFSPSLAEYGRMTTPFNPTIAAVKAYQRDRGELPLDNWSLPDQYKPPVEADRGEIYFTTSITFPGPEHSVLEYEFSPASEGWYVHAPRRSGRLPVPVVPAAPGPVTRSTARPASRDFQIAR